MRDAV